MGRPLDEVDSICKNFSQCQKCNKMSTCSGSFFESYQISFNPVTDTYTCQSSSECASDSCACAGEMGIQLARALIDHGNMLEAAHNSVDASACVRGTGLVSNDACCGNVPFATPYSSSSNTCVNGQVI